MRKTLLEKLNLDHDSVQILEQIIMSIDYYAELTESDVFLDCFPDKNVGIVVAHGKPKDVSLYCTNITGAEVLFQNEPMVFYTRETGIGMRDARALSQESKMVLQRTTPIKNKSGQVIAVLIQERDDTERFILKDKLNNIEEVSEKLSGSELVCEEIHDLNRNESSEDILIQETHHRVKNNLQTISSILRLQHRRCKCAETKSILQDDITMINGLASMYEIITNAHSDIIDLYDVVKKLILCISKIYENDEHCINIRLHGDHILMPYYKIQSLTLIINELIQNSYKHGAFKQEGNIHVNLINGNMYGIIHVTDNGIGIKESDISSRSLGLNIVKMLAKEKLKGSFSIKGNACGTVASLHFPL